MICNFQKSVLVLLSMLLPACTTYYSEASDNDNPYAPGIYARTRYVGSGYAEPINHSYDDNSADDDKSAALLALLGIGLILNSESGYSQPTNYDYSAPDVEETKPWQPPEAQQPEPENPLFWPTVGAAGGI
jgi:hypothetical protein